MASRVYTEEQLNYFRICYIATDILPQGLRAIFKQEWDNRYKATFGEWNDTHRNGLDFKNGELFDNQIRNAQLLATMKNGNRAEWDCTKLFYAVLYSDCIYGLHPRIRSNVHVLRTFRNNFAHMLQGQLSDSDFIVAVGKVETAFQALGLSTVEIQTVSKKKSFPTDELKNVTKKAQTLIQALQTELQEKHDKLQTTEEQRQVLEEQRQVLEEQRQVLEEKRQVLEEQLMNEAESFCVLPPRPPHPIAGRDCEVANIKHVLSNLKKANVNSLSHCYISGNPGSGKSQLAGLVAKKFYEEAIKDTSAPSFVMTLRAENSEALLTSFVSLARNLRCPQHTVTNTLNSKDMTIEEKIADLKDLVTTKIQLYASWLLVVDNVESLADTRTFLLEPGNEQWGKGLLLITTQDSSCIPADSSFTSHISVSKGMEPTDASCFLATISGVTDQDVQDQVTKALDYQPLALASAGTYVKQVHITNPTFGWKDYLEKLEQGKRALTENALTKTNQSYPNSMTVATRIAVDKVMNSNEVLKHAFTFFALCAPELLRLDILTNYILIVDKELDKEEIAIQIQGSSLLLMEKEEDVVCFRLHQVVYDVVKLLVKDCMETDETVRAVDAVVKSFNQFIDEMMPQSWKSPDSVAESRNVVPHLKTLTVELGNIFSTEEKYQCFKSTTLNLLRCLNHFRRLGVICSNHSELFSAKEYLSAAIQLVEEIETRYDESISNYKYADVAATYYYMGVVQDHLGDYQQAKDHHERALSIRLKKLEPEHIDVARSYNSLGVVQQHLGDNQQAKQYFERALSIQKKLDPEHIDVARSYHSLGVVQQQLGDYQQAKAYFERALSIQQKKLEPAEHIDVARSYHSLGDVQQHLGDYQQAMEHIERALDIQQKKLGPEHVEVAHIYRSMGVVQHNLGNNQQAKEYYERALSILVKKLGPEHVDVARSYLNLGCAQCVLGDYQQAKKHTELALSIQVKKLEPEHVDVARTSYHNLGFVECELGNYQQAKDHFERALDIHIKTLGPEHVDDEASCYHSLGVLQVKLGDYQQAKEHYERALAIQMKTLGPEHIDVALTRRQLSDVQRALDDHQQAREQHDRN